jgi:uncharacterized protein (TIGR03083 family)
VTDATAVDDWIAAVTSSHRRLVGATAPLGADQVAGPSYASEWSIADVLSHMGSGAEIFGLVLAAGLQGDPPPGMAEFEPLWARWNAKSPEDQVADALVADRRFIDLVDALDDQAREAWQVTMFGGEQRLVDLLKMRLGEHALHTWDVVVMGEPDAVLAPDAVGLLIDTIGQLVARVGKSPDPAAIRVRLDTTRPVRRFVLVAEGERAELQPAGEEDGADAATVLSLPAESFIRLVYGRLDPQHTPDFTGDAATLDALRRTFPGF